MKPFAIIAILLSLLSCGGSRSASVEIAFDPPVGRTVSEGSGRSCSVTMTIRERNGVGVIFYRETIRYLAAGGDFLFMEEFDRGEIVRRYGTDSLPAYGSAKLTVTDVVGTGDPPDFDVSEALDFLDDNGHRMTLGFTRQCRE
jgi:hypothetical protein